MPARTLGFRLSGKISRDEYFQILDPVREQLERGGPGELRVFEPRELEAAKAWTGGGES